VTLAGQELQCEAQEITLVRLEPLISDVMPLEELKRAIGMLGENDGRRMKIIRQHL
jgi:hypothetical protein